MKKATSLFLAMVFSAALFVHAQETDGYQIGDVVDDFTLVNVDGTTVSLGDYTDQKGIILIFTCNTCPVAAAYEDRIIALDAKYKPQGFPVVAVNPNDPGVDSRESGEEMKKRAADKGFTFPYLLDPGHLTTLKFGATRTPHAFVVVNTDAGMQLQYIGAIDDDSEGGEPENNYVEDAIAAINAGQAPTPSFTKAVGCTIKWKKGG